MISIFKKVRQKLISENRLPKYFAYAVGEILLVVIGILIALGVNNLKEQKKDDQTERFLLKQVKTENDYNLEIFNQNARDYQKVEQNLLEMVTALADPPSPKRDSLIQVHLNGLLNISKLVFSEEYILRYLNASQLNDNELIPDFIEMKDFYLALEQASQSSFDYKFANILTWIEDAIDLTDGKIHNMSKLEDRVFINRIIILGAIELEIAEKMKDGHTKAKKIDSLLNLKLSK